MMNRQDQTLKAALARISVTHLSPSRRRVRRLKGLPKMPIRGGAAAFHSELKKTNAKPRSELNGIWRRFWFAGGSTLKCPGLLTTRGSGRQVEEQRFTAKHKLLEGS